VSDGARCLFDRRDLVDHRGRLTTSAERLPFIFAILSKAFKKSPPRQKSRHQKSPPFPGRSDKIQLKKERFATAFLAGWGQAYGPLAAH
jgi:hypothetical protein